MAKSQIEIIVEELKRFYSGSKVVDKLFKALLDIDKGYKEHISILTKRAMEAEGEIVRLQKETEEAEICQQS